MIVGAACHCKENNMKNKCIVKKRSFWKCYSRIQCC